MKTDTTSTTTESKTETSPSTEPKIEGEAKKPDASTAPAAYSDFTVPEGVTLSRETVEAFTPIARELGLTQEQAQKLVSFHAEQMRSLAADPVAAIKTQERTWSAETLADKDISAYALDGKTGLEAVKLDIGRAKAVLEPALRAEFERVMNWTGIGSNPAFVKAFWRIGQHITEGRPVTGAGPSPEGQRAPGSAAKPSPAKAMYPNLG